MKKWCTSPGFLFLCITYLRFSQAFHPNLPNGREEKWCRNLFSERSCITFPPLPGILQRRKNWRRMLPLLLFVVNSNPLWNNRLLLFPISKTECCAKKRLQNQNKNKSTDNTCDFLLICRNRIPVHPNYRKFGKKAYAKQDIYIPIGFSIIFFIATASIVCKIIPTTKNMTNAYIKYWVLWMYRICTNIEIPTSAHPIIISIYLLIAPPSALSTEHHYLSFI